MPIHSRSIWHSWQPINFILVLDDFRIKYTGMQHEQYLLELLQQVYDMSINSIGTLYHGITLTLDYTK